MHMWDRIRTYAYGVRPSRSRCSGRSAFIDGTQDPWLVAFREREQGAPSGPRAHLDELIHGVATRLVQVDEEGEELLRHGAAVVGAFVG